MVAIQDTNKIRATEELETQWIANCVTVDLGKQHIKNNGAANPPYSKLQAFSFTKRDTVRQMGEAQIRFGLSIFAILVRSIIDNLDKNHWSILYNIIHIQSLWLDNWIVDFVNQGLPGW